MGGVMKQYISIVILVILVGCTTIGTEITKKNNHIQMPHYSLVVPPDQEWHIVRQDDKTEATVITKKLGPFIFQMKTMINTILDEIPKTASAKTIANDFRNIEKQIMIEEGVNKGLYQLQGLTMSEETVGEKKFYTMSYVISANTGVQRASLYLYFPKEEESDYFFIAHYSETIPLNAFLVKSFKPEFLETLKSLHVSE